MHAGDRRGRLVDQVRVDRVHQPGADLPHRRAQHPHNRDGDHQPDDRVRPRPAQRHPAGPEQHRQAGEPIGAGVQAVGDQRRAADPPPDLDPVPRHPFVADEPHHRRGRDHPQMTDRARVDQPVDRLVAGQHRRQRDHRDHEQPAEILRAAIPVGVALRRRPAARAGTRSTAAPPSTRPPGCAACRPTGPPTPTPPPRPPGSPPSPPEPPS